MEISYKKDGNHNFLIMKEEKIDEEDYKLQMIINNNIEGIIPLSIKKINNKPEVHYEITSMLSLESMYAKKQISGREMYALIKSIKKLADNLKEYLIDINHIVFGVEFVYLKRQEQKYMFCYYPQSTINFQDSIRNFFDKLLEYINHNDKTAVLIAYGVQQITISDSFTVQDLMECAEKNIQASEQKYKLPARKQESFENTDKEDLNNIKKRVDQPNKTGIFKIIAGIFKGKKKYQDEDELLYNAENEIYNSGEEKLKNEKSTENIIGETEDATMLLTSYGAIEAITLRRVDEEAMEITPSRFPCVLGKSKRSSDFYVDSPVVSRVHMRISENMAEYFVEDLNSTNGTFVNGVQLMPYELKEIKIGDQITLADVDFLVESKESKWYTNS